MKLCHKMKVYKRGNGEDGTYRPEIRLLGHWLQKSGFGIGQEICVTILDNDKILIEKTEDTVDNQTLIDLEKWFDKESKELKKDIPNILNWIRMKGGIDPQSRAADVFELKQKESGFNGKSSLIRKNGKGLDVLRDEAEWEGIINPSISTDEFGQMIKDQVRLCKRN